MIGPWQLGLIIIVLGIPLLATIDILRHRFRDNEKLIWLLVVLFMPFVGTLLYLGLGRKKRIK
ncbi:PLDc N-terminal domain-containing protein [Dokdonia donghaensis]|uniref:Cardiolipin synthase N-terminal domain-containing protein n=2 Tax=Dokdonia TaxID=326319 RepID=A0A0A2GXG1_9FLAO|nr:PLDc N-terminal domain-containing protein [Dokdonia donghaensis]KGO07897.1 hypothetical protein NV36_00325 [Dokdonia donghaensis DSW-1]